MSFAKSALPQIKWSLLTFCLSLAISGSAIWLSNDYIDSSLKKRQEAQRQLNDARTKLSATENDLQNMSAYAQEYDLLMNRRVIGDEQRLDWMEGLERLRQQNHVMDFKYTIAPQQVYTPNPPLDAGNFDLHLSNMTLQLDLLHEEQLLTFFTALRSNMPGWFILDKCTLESLAVSGMADTPTLGPQLKADCTGGWLTMKNRNAP